MYDLLSALIYWGISFVSITSQGFVSIRIVPVNCDLTVARGFFGGVSLVLMGLRLARFGNVAPGESN